MERSVHAPSESIFRAFLAKHAMPLVAATFLGLVCWFLVFMFSRTVVAKWVPAAAVRCDTSGHCWIDVFVVGAVLLVGGCLLGVVVAMQARTPWGLMMRIVVSPLHALVGIWYWEGVASLFFDIPAGTTPWRRRAALITLGGVASLLVHVLAFLMAMAVVTIFVIFLPEPTQGLGCSTVTCSLAEAGLVLGVAATGCSGLVVKAAILSEALALLLLIGGASFVVDIALGLMHLIRVSATAAGIGKAPLNEGTVGNGLAANLVHISDLHVVASEETRRCESPVLGPQGNSHLRARLAQLAPALQAADAVVVSGDLTDTGSHAEWREFLALMDDLPAQVRERLFIISGNHDLNFIERDDLRIRERRADTETFTGRRLRTCLFALVMAKIQSDRCEVARFDSSDEVRWAPMNDVLEPQLAAIQRTIDEIEQGKDAPSSDLDLMDLFPMVWLTTSRSGTKLAFIGTNTCGVGTTIVNNAMGQFAWKRLTAVVKEVVRAGYYPVVVGHHHILPFFEGRGPDGRSLVSVARTQGGPEKSSLGQRIKGVVSLVFMVAKDGVQAYRAFRAASAGSGFTYLHGHRHVTRFLTEQLTTGGTCHISGAPSLLFGDEFTHDHRSAGMGLTLLKARDATTDVESHRMVGGVAMLL
jgi:hypothetical protein